MPPCGTAPFCSLGRASRAAGRRPPPEQPLKAVLRFLRLNDSPSWACPGGPGSLTIQGIWAFFRSLRKARLTPPKGLRRLQALPEVLPPCTSCSPWAPRGHPVHTELSGDPRCAHPAVASLPTAHSQSVGESWGSALNVYPDSNFPSQIPPLPPKTFHFRLD